jgi:cytochrome b subunit of formate dehydrogenase
LVIGWIATGLPSFAWILVEALRLAVSFAGAAVMAALLSHVYLAIVGGQRTAE